MDKDATAQRQTYLSIDTIASRRYKMVFRLLVDSAL
jgi:hypothetical protein